MMILIEEAAYAIWMGEGEYDRREEDYPPMADPMVDPSEIPEADLWSEWADGWAEERNEGLEREWSG